MKLSTTKKIDELGRVVLPETARKAMGWPVGDTVSIYQADKNTLILQLSEKCPGPKCIFCDATETAVTINGKDICKLCLEKANAGG